MGDDSLQVGLHEALLTERLDHALRQLDADRVEPAIGDVDPGSTADRFARHLAALIGDAIDAANDDERAQKAVDLAEAITGALVAGGLDEDVRLDIPLRPARVLRAI